MCGLPNDGADEIVRNHYATRFADAWEAAERLRLRDARLEGTTRRFHAVLFDSHPAAEVVDAVIGHPGRAAQHHLLPADDGRGRFAAWEGSFDHAGSCEGTCTHVWGYA